MQVLKGSSLLIQTEEVGKEIIGGAADVHGNISGEMKNRRSKMDVMRCNGIKLSRQSGHL